MDTSSVRGEAGGGAGRLPLAPVRTRAPNRSPDEIRSLLVAATVALLSEGPPAGVTVRAIADRAGVQHSLITRHFASKDQLVAVALSQLAAEYRGIVEAGSDPVDGYLRALDHLRANPTAAMALTAGPSAREDDSPEVQFPGYTAHLTQILAAGAADDDRTRLVAGVALALIAGWSVLGTNLLTAGGLRDRDPAEVHDEVAGIIARLIERETERSTGEHPPDALSPDEHPAVEHPAVERPAAPSPTPSGRARSGSKRRTTKTVDERTSP